MVPRVRAEVAVVVTRHRIGLILFLLTLSLYSATGYSVVLPEERTDVMYHRYDGGGMVIEGPSVLVRKNFAEKFSISANYYVDKVSSASIDVETIEQGASRYSEERTEKSADVSWLHDDTTFTAGYTTSSENDYEARSYRFDISHTFFGEMTTFSAGYSQGNDDITSSQTDTIDEELERRHYRLGVAQVLTKNLIANLNLEAIIDEGYLQNPYRKILSINLPSNRKGSFVDPDPMANEPQEYERLDERYPSTKNSEAISLKLSYHLPWEAAIKSRLGYYSDSWGINGYSFELDYSHKLTDKWLVDFRLRHYQQSDADFYANLFYSDNVNSNFVGRDKELSKYTSNSIGFGASYEKELNNFIDRLRLNTQIDWMFFSYDNFREVTNETEIVNGIEAEPLYSFDAYALRVFITVFY